MVSGGVPVCGLVSSTSPIECSEAHSERPTFFAPPDVSRRISDGFAAGHSISWNFLVITLIDADCCHLPFMTVAHRGPSGSATQSKTNTSVNS